jgi:hypothetical protein
MNFGGMDRGLSQSAAVALQEDVAVSCDRSAGDVLSDETTRAPFTVGRAALPRRRGERYSDDPADRQVSPTMPIGNRQSAIGNFRAFSLVELLVTMTLLSLIVLVLMAVFSETQTAFRASVTQTDVLEGSRAAVDLITADLRAMAPANGNYTLTGNFYSGTSVSSNAVNFLALDNYYAYPSWSGGTLLYHPLLQTLPGSTVLRTNELNYFFAIGRENMKWTAVGYVVNATNTQPLYPLYRFYAETNITAPAVTLYWAFVNMVNQSQWTNMSHVLDGVVHLTAKVYDSSGYLLTNYYQWRGGQWVTNNNMVFLRPPQWTEPGCYFFSNAVPAAVEFEMGVLEDRALQRAGSFGNSLAASNYLSQQSGHVHIFRQRVSIPNVDPSAYP